MARRDAEADEYQRGQRPPCPPNAIPLLVIGMDRGRYQSREKDAKTDGRWREAIPLFLRLLPHLRETPGLERQTELAEAMPGQVVGAWLGNTEEVAKGW